MKILVLNGSPKREKSNTMRLTRAFLQGMAQKEMIEQEILNVADLDIRPCLGCFACWRDTPGKCCIPDGMASVIQKILAADVILYSFPLYYYGLPSQLKALLDRQLPMNLPFMEKRRDGNWDSGSHPPRYDMSKKRYLFLSTCGFYTAEGNYDALNLQLDRCFGKGGYDTLYCGQGELFSVPEVAARTGEYLEFVREAGAQYALGGITDRTRGKLSQLLFPREVFEEMADAHWGEAALEGLPAKGPEERRPNLPFTKQMAALYNPGAWDGKDRVLEMHYTDTGETYQILMGMEGHKVLTEDFLPSTTRIETPSSVWRDIAGGKLSGQQALMDRLYRVEGGFDLMLKWDDFFGMAQPPAALEEHKKEKNSNMLLFLLPWFPLWTVMPINLRAGAVLDMALCAGLCFAFLKWKATFFDCAALAAGIVFSLLAMLGAPVRYLVPGSYLLFGVMWSATVFLRIPLSAYYSMNGYGGEKAFQNGLFIRTNRILTACWGVLYLLTPLWTYFLVISPQGWISGLANSILPGLLGLFTAWFQKWYPAWYAGRA